MPPELIVRRSRIEMSRGAAAAQLPQSWSKLWLGLGGTLGQSRARAATPLPACGRACVRACGRAAIGRARIAARAALSHAGAFAESARACRRPGRVSYSEV